MRIQQLDLKAFGHFTDRRIRFDGPADLHIAYGPNEAGKSTLARALRAALFGIPERTGDNHLHANQNLRIGVVLTAADGRQLAVMRRKARKNSLLKYDPESGEETVETIADTLLSGWLSSLTEGLYTSMFGLDHDTLVAGGRELAEGKGELGQILFEAGAGLTSIRSLRERLTREADELFRPRASSSAIYRTLDAYGEARKEARDAQTRPADWESLHKTAAKAEAEYQAARDGQSLRQAEARRLERLAAVLPDVAARSLALKRLAELGEAVRLPQDCPERRLAAQTRLRGALQALDGANDNLRQLRDQLEGIHVPAAILAEAAAVESLHYGVAHFRSAREAAASARGRLAHADDRIAELTAAIGVAPEAARQLIPDAVLRAGIRSLSTQDAQLRAELEAALRQVREAQEEFAGTAADLERLGPRQVPPALARLLQEADAQGNLEGKRDELKTQVAALEAALLREAAALTDGPMETLIALNPPLPAVTAGLRSRRTALETRRQSLRDRLESLEDDRAMVGGEMEGLLLQAEVPTAEHLAQRRAERDDLWHRLRCRLFGSGPDDGEDEGQPTAAEYEWAVQAADGVADRRFADAARVAQHAELAKRLSQLQQGTALEQERLARTEAGIGEVVREWQGTLARHGLPDLDMNELDDWLNRRNLFTQRHAGYLALHEEWSAAAAWAEAARHELSSALCDAGQPTLSPGESLAQALGRARSVVAAAAQAASREEVLLQKRQNAIRRHKDAQERLDDCRRLQEAWQDRWIEAMTALRLPANASGMEADARLSQLEMLENQLNLRDAAAAELNSATTVLDAAERETARLCQVLGRETHGPADVIAQTLWLELEDARGLAARSRTLQDQLREAAKSREKAEQSQKAAEQELSELMAAAGCHTLEALQTAERLSAERRLLEEDIARIEQRLVTASALPLSAVLQQAAGQDLVQVHGALTRETEEIAIQAPVIEALHARLIHARGELGRVDGEAVAAAAEQKAAEAAAALSHLVARYASTRLASAILAEVIETYQQRHQGPLLARASQLFAAITGGRFTKVATDFDDDKTILVGVRSNGRRELVAHLSTGTRDQLFLALRLAAIESHVSGQEPMPVAVDDIVVNFDDAAAGATFQVLAELSRKTQVLFFTHHEHLLEKAAASIGADNFTTHRL